MRRARVGVGRTQRERDTAREKQGARRRADDAAPTLQRRFATPLLPTPPRALPQTQKKFPVGRVRILLSDDVVVAPNATVITSAGQAIRVDVSGVKEPLEADVVAAYAAGSDPTAVVPLAWGALAADSTRRRRYLDTGAGSVT